MKIYTTEEARAKLGTILAGVSRGENALISYHGILVAQIGPPPDALMYSKDGGEAKEDHHR